MAFTSGWFVHNPVLSGSVDQGGAGKLVVGGRSRVPSDCCCHLLAVRASLILPSSLPSSHHARSFPKSEISKARVCSRHWPSQVTHCIVAPCCLQFWFGFFSDFPAPLNTSHDAPWCQGAGSKEGANALFEIRWLLRYLLLCMPFKAQLNPTYIASPISTYFLRCILCNNYISIHVVLIYKLRCL